MRNPKRLFAAALLLASLATAQTAATKPKVQVVTPNTKSPSKVTGDGVKTDSGLQYWDIKVGTGVEAKDGDHVKVHYTGWFTDGKKFDSSVDAHQPYEFTLGKGDVIKGWDEGVTGMKSRRQAATTNPAGAGLRREGLQRDHPAQDNADLRRAIAGRDANADGTA